MAIPNQKEFKYPVLNVISKNSHIGAQELYKKIQELFHPSKEDLAITTNSGEKKFNNTIRWVILDLKKIGFIESIERGQYRITELGEKELENNNFSPDDLLMDSGAELDPIQDSNFEDSEQVVLSSDDYYESIEEELLRRLKKMGDNSVNKGTLFETLCLELLKKMGYGEPEQRGGAGDRGIDGFLTRDFLGFERIGVQCKCYSEGKVDDNEITKFAHGLKNVHGCTKGVFITTSDFLPRARKAAEETKDVKIILIHGVRLAKLMREHKIGVRVRDTNYIYDITIGENT